MSFLTRVMDGLKEEVRTEDGRTTADIDLPSSDETATDANDDAPSLTPDLTRARRIQIIPSALIRNLSIRNLSTSFQAKLIPQDTKEFDVSASSASMNPTVRIHFDSLDEAKVEAQKSQKLILVINGEIPQEDADTAAFSHPLLVEAAESPTFVTVFLEIPPQSQNDEKKNKQSKQPHQIIDIMNDAGKDMIPELGKGLWTKNAVSSLMVQALEKHNIQVPKYLKLVQEEETGRSRVGRCGTFYRVERHALFSMESVIKGEIDFAAMNGILETRTGHILIDENGTVNNDFREKNMDCTEQEQQCAKMKNVPVVRVTYDSSRMSFGKLVRGAIKRNIADICFCQNSEERVAVHVETLRMQKPIKLLWYDPHSNCAASPNMEESCKQSKQPLRETLLRYVPLTALQATRANRLVYKDRFNEASNLLSPMQEALLMLLTHSISKEEARIECIGVPIKVAWERISNNDF